LPDDPQSPYLQWAISPADEGRTAPPTESASDILSPRAPWLAGAIRTALDDEPQKWPGLLRRFLTDAGFAPNTAESTGKKIESPSGLLPLARDRVIVAVIDDGISFAHERFRSDAFDSRVDFLWLQGADHDGANADVPFGRELDRGQIEDLFQDHRRGQFGDLLDEEGVYRAAGAMDMGTGSFQSLARRAGHGTAIVDLAAGFAAGTDSRDRTFRSLPERMGISPEAYDLALVTLPQTVTADTSGTFTEIFIIIALVRLLDHIEQRSLRDGQDYPIIVNLSFGLTAGPKDGSSLLDRFIDQINQSRGFDRAPISIVMPAGNHRLSQCHAVLNQPLTKDAAPLFWRVLPDDPTPSFLEIWTAPLPNKPDVNPLSLGLKVAAEPMFSALPAGPVDVSYSLRRNGKFLARAYVQWVAGASGAGRVRVTLAVPASIAISRGAPFVPPGDWQLNTDQVEEYEPSIWPLDLTIQRDDMIPGFRGGGRQSHFADNAYRTNDLAGHTITEDRPDENGALPYVRRVGTLNSLATAKDTVVVGGCYADTLRAVGYSGEGSTASGVRGADVVAPASVSRSRSGIRVAGSRSGSRIGVEGTSAAAPTVARELAKATRPITERPRLSGISLLRPDFDGKNVPTLLPIAEDLTKTRTDEIAEGLWEK
jgi:hypothetical protein